MALQNALHTKEITTAQVTAVSFGFFSEDEVRACDHAGHKLYMHPNCKGAAASPNCSDSIKREFVIVMRNCIVLFFSTLQIRKISVKQIVSPIIFDNLKNPIKGGLYDPCLGPMDPKEK